MLVNIDPTGGTKVEELESVSFSKIPFGTNAHGLERHLEDLIADNINLVESVMDDEESNTLLIIGRQVGTSTGRRLDLVAIDSSGGLILIEVKRDADDVKNRKEHAEIQAVRYAASIARLRTVDQIVAAIYGPYITRFQEKELKANGGGRTAEEWARKKLIGFMQDNGIELRDINNRQEIVLIGAGFDDDTRSAVAWMAKNDLPIRIIELQPHSFGAQWFLNVQQIIPIPAYEDFYTDVVAASATSSTPKVGNKKSRQSRIRVQEIIEAGKLTPGDEICFRTTPQETAKLIDHRTCRYDGTDMSIIDFGKMISGWSSVNVYSWIVHVPTGKTIEELRVEVEEQESKPAAEPVAANPVIAQEIGTATPDGANSKT